MRRARIAGLAAALAGAAIALHTAAGAAATNELADYDPNSTAWNGMASFVGLASGDGYEVAQVPSLEWGDLTDHDILFLVYPLERVDPAKLGAFVQAGGNVVIADDFGDAKDALAALGLLRAEVVTPRGAKYQDGRVWAPIATPLADHPIAEGVGEVVTNHPAALSHVEGAATVIGFPDGAGVVVAGVRGTGRFVAVSDPSIFINEMLAFPGNIAVTINILRWLDRHDSGASARRVVLLRGDTEMYGEPRPFIADPNGGAIGHGIADLNFWLSERSLWLLTAGAMKGLAAALAVVLLALAVIALPVRRGPKVDGAWLRFARPARRDDPHLLVDASERGGGGLLVLACVLRDHVQSAIADAIGRAEPLYTLSETEITAQLRSARGAGAASAFGLVYRRLRALPSRGQAAAPWSAGHLARRDFDALYRDAAELCRTLGAPLTAARTEVA